MAKSPSKSDPPNNRLIAGLPKKDRVGLLTLCEEVQLTLAQVICERGQALRYDYFPTDSFVSFVSAIDGSPGVEVGMVGSESMVGAQLALGIAKAPLHGVVQGAGPAWRIKASDLRRLMTKSESLRAALNRDLYGLIMQLATSAACLRFHEIGPRLARRLLMSQDRLQGRELVMTQELISNMLGVRRESVTEGELKLQEAGVIRYVRGRITVLDRRGLEKRTCECYQVVKTEYDRLLPRRGATSQGSSDPAMRAPWCAPTITPSQEIEGLQVGD